MGDPLDRIDQQQGHVRFLEDLAGPHDGEELHVLPYPRLAADSGRVDHPVGLTIDVDNGVDGVAGGPGDRGHHHPLRPDQPVQQGRLADVGPSDDRQGGELVVVVALHRLGQQRHGGVEEVGNAGAVDGTHR